MEPLAFFFHFIRTVLQGWVPLAGKSKNAILFIGGGHQNNLAALISSRITPVGQANIIIALILQLGKQQNRAMNL